MFTCFVRRAQRTGEDMTFQDVLFAFEHESTFRCNKKHQVNLKCDLLNDVTFGVPNMINFLAVCFFTKQTEAGPKFAFV